MILIWTNVTQIRKKHTYLDLLSYNSKTFLNYINIEIYMIAKKVIEIILFNSLKYRKCMVWFLKAL